MDRIDKRALVFGALKAGLVVLHAANDCAGEEDLGKFGACIEGVWADVGVDLVEGGEFRGGEGSAVEVGGLENKAGVGRCLEVWEEG